MLEHSPRLPRARTLLQETPEKSSVSTCAGEPAPFASSTNAERNVRGGFGVEAARDATASHANRSNFADEQSDVGDARAVDVDVRALVEELCSRHDCEVVARVHTPQRAAQFAAWPEHFGEQVRGAFAARGVQQPYAHQVRALRAIHERRDLVLATPTASGKSLCYRAPILQALIDEPRARALMLFPTKALSRDQVEGFRVLSEHVRAGGRGPSIGAGVYDGDTPPDARRAARAKAQVVATNPDMLHRAILPNHDRWAALFAGLRFVVLDELHTYRGVFGSHVANVMRRLWRLCAFYGSRPQVIACSATIANARELTERVISRRGVEVVDQSSAAQGAKHFVVLNPRVVDETTGVRGSYLKLARKVTHTIAESGMATLAFCRTRKAVELLTRYLREDAAQVSRDRFGVPKGPVDERAMSRATQQIRGYRGGYLPEHRREVERALREGEARVVASTNALELGMDVGGLDAVVLAGYPGTRAATHQRAGRAGRRGRESLVAMILSSRPLDQFLAADTDFLFGQPPEHARIDPDNPEILVPHLRCAVHELPLSAGEGLAGLQPGTVDAMLDYLADRGSVLRDTRSNGAGVDDVRYLGLGGDFPAQQVDLRGGMEENFTVVERVSREAGGLDRAAEQGRILAEVDFEDGPLYLHPGAIYPLDGRTYEVRELDWDARKAFVRLVQSDYYTEAISKLRVRIVDPVVESTPVGGLSASGVADGRVLHGVGYAHLVRAVPGFKKLRFGSHENVGFGPIELPDLELHTVAAWWRVPPALLETVSDPDQRAQAVLGAAHAMQFCAAMLCMCDVNDLGHAVGSGHDGSWAPVTRRASGGNTGPEGELVASGIPTLYLYDKLSGGAGLSTQIHELGAEFFARVEQAVAGCACADGCPTCTGAEGAAIGPDTPFGARRNVLEVLRSLREGLR